MEVKLYYAVKIRNYFCSCIHILTANTKISVKKDDAPLELPSIPSVPKSFSELWESVKSTGSSLLSDKHKTGDHIGKNNENKVFENSSA